MTTGMFVRRGSFVACALAIGAGAAHAAVTLNDTVVLYTIAGGSSNVLVDFDSIQPGTDIGSQSINGITFNQLGSPLIVVTGSSTYTPPDVFNNVNDINNNVLTPTSGKNLLSPGGSELGSGEDLDHDSIELVLSTPVSSLAFDMMYQSLDGFSFVGMTAYDADGNVLYDNGLVDAGSSFDGNAGGVQFYGFTSDSGELIARLVISEFDDDTANPDANIGIDTIRGGVPTPGAVSLLALAGLIGLRRRK